MMPIATEPFANVTSYIGCRTHGAGRIVVLSHGSIEDLDGAVAAQDVGLGKSVGQDLMLQSSAIRSSFANGRLLTTSAPHDVGFDPFAGLDPDVLTTCLDILAELAACDAPDALSGVAALIRRFARETEDMLGWSEPLPVVRQPGGMFPALRMMRDWNGAIERHQLPALLPESWTKPSQLGDRS